jgi:hypothetical protein
MVLSLNDPDPPPGPSLLPLFDRLSSSLGLGIRDDATLIGGDDRWSSTRPEVVDKPDGRVVGDEVVGDRRRTEPSGALSPFLVGALAVEEAALFLLMVTTFLGEGAAISPSKFLLALEGDD